MVVLRTGLYSSLNDQRSDLVGSLQRSSEHSCQEIVIKLYGPAVGIELLHKHILASTCCQVEKPFDNHRNNAFISCTL